MKTILFLSPVSFFKGGAERSLFDLVDNPGVSPIIIVPQEGEISRRAKELGIRCDILDFGNVNNINRPFSFIKAILVIKSLYNASCKLKELTKKYQANCVHSNGLKAHAINCFARVLGNVPAIIHIRDIPNTKSEKIAWWLLGFLSSIVIVVSKPCWPFNNFKKVHIVHNGINIEKINPPKNLKNIKPLRIGFIGRIDHAKGLHLLLDWIYYALHKGCDLTLSIRGDFDSASDSYKNQIIEKIKNLSLSDAVSFSGFISDPSIIYDNLDVVVVPSHIPDPLPRSVMEAMSLGLLVMGYPAGGIPSMIENDINGFLVSNEQEFLNSIESIFKNDQKIIDIKNNAQNKILTSFTLEQLHKNLNNIYNRLDAKV